MAETAAVLVDGDIHKTLISPEQEESPAYIHAVLPLKIILAAHPEIRFLYTMTLHDGKPCFILDATPPGDTDHDGINDHSSIIQPFDTPAPALLEALRSGTTGVDPEPIKDPWGTFLSGYAPIHDSIGHCVGIVGVDLKIQEYSERLSGMKRSLMLGIMAALGLAVLNGLGVWWFGRRVLRAEKDHRDTSEALQVSEAHCQTLARNYRMLFEQMVNGFALHEMIFDAEGKPIDYRFLDVNPAFERLTGLVGSTILGRSVKEVLPQTEAYWIEAYGRVVLTGVPIHYENYAQDLDRYFQVTAYRPVPGQFACIIADITQQKHLEAERLKEQEQLQHVQKLEGLGLLAGGIAHDFNNLLMAILGNTDLAIADLPTGSPLTPNLYQIKQISLQAAELCKQMLAYSGKGKFVVEAVDISRLVGDMSKLVEVSVSKKVALHYQLSENLPAIEADATQIRQVIMNLVINASEAIGDKSGALSLSTGVMNCDEKFLQDAYHCDACSPGKYVYLEVSDSGCGMDKETQSRIFDPFYTTKFTGRGLGLAAVMGIVRGHQGIIKIFSEYGKGSTFKVLFPASGAIAAESRVSGSTVWKGAGTILLADDEESVRSVTQRMLERMGFSVLTASNGREAVQVFEEFSDKLVCVLMDLTMPYMDGDEALSEMHRIRADVPIILSSGYNPQEIEARNLGKGLAGFLQKPYQLATLSETIRAVITPRS